MSTPEHNRKIGHWDRYWSYGNLHSFSQVSKGNYGGAIARFWNKQFSSIVDGGRILDVGTGNGALLVLAKKLAQSTGKSFLLTGIDLADIDPASQVRDPQLVESLKGIRFISKTGAECLPFDSLSVDMACSQYGVEYSDTSRSISELYRVLAPQGCFVSVAHHGDSELLAAARLELSQLDFVLDELKLFESARKVLRTRSKVSGDVDHPELVARREDFKYAVARLQEAAKGSSQAATLLGPLHYMREIFDEVGTRPIEDSLALLEEAYNRVWANHTRLQDMQRAALDLGGIEQLNSRLTEAGFVDGSVAEFKGDDGKLLGWRIQARKNL